MDVEPQVQSYIGPNAHVTASGAVSVSAHSMITAEADMFGVSAGGLAVGVSLTNVTISPDIVAALGDPNDFTSGGVDVTAGSPTVQANTAQRRYRHRRIHRLVGALVGVTRTDAEGRRQHDSEEFSSPMAQSCRPAAVVVDNVLDVNLFDLDWNNTKPSNPVNYPWPDIQVMSSADVGPDGASGQSITNTSGTVILATAPGGLGSYATGYSMPRAERAAFVSNCPIPITLCPPGSNTRSALRDWLSRQSALAFGRPAGPT